MNETDRFDFFFACKLVTTILTKYFTSYSVLDKSGVPNLSGRRIPKGALIVYYNISDKLAQDKSYEL